MFNGWNFENVRAMENISLMVTVPPFSSSMDTTGVWPNAMYECAYFPYEWAPLREDVQQVNPPCPAVGNGRLQGPVPVLER